MQSMRLKCMFAPLLMTCDSIAEAAQPRPTCPATPKKNPSGSSRPHKKRNMFLLRLAHARLKGRAQGAGHGHKGVKLAHRIGEGCRPRVWQCKHTQPHTDALGAGEAVGKENRNIKSKSLRCSGLFFLFNTRKKASTTGSR